MRLASIEILDDCSQSEKGAIEVVLNIEGGSRRWCYFITPEGLAAAGDWLPGTEVHAHFGNPHMIVVSSISPAIIELAIRTIESKGLIESCSIAC
jgi:hypothetical protein